MADGLSETLIDLHCQRIAEVSGRQKKHCAEEGSEVMDRGRIEEHLCLTNICFFNQFPALFFFFFLPPTVTLLT